MRDSRRREALAEAATDYVLGAGLIGLSLRPMAAAVGTSDRMLLYHFDDKADLVATVLRVSNDRAVVAIDALPAAPDLARAVESVWQAFTRPPLEECQRLYVEAAALGLLGEAPYLSVVREANDAWVRSLERYLARSGCPQERVGRAVRLLDAALMGLQLDLPVDRDDPATLASVADLAEAVVLIAHRPA